MPQISSKKPEVHSAMSFMAGRFLTNGGHGARQAVPGDMLACAAGASATTKAPTIGAQGRASTTLAGQAEAPFALALRAAEAFRQEGQPNWMPA